MIGNKIEIALQCLMTLHTRMETHERKTSFKRERPTKNVLLPKPHIAPPLKVRGALPLEVPRDNFLGQHFQVWWFLGPPDQNELYHTP